MSMAKQIYRSLIQGPIYILIFGLIFLAIGAGPTLTQLLIEREGEQAQGEVIRLAERCDSDGCTYAPVVSFVLRNGQTVTFESSYSSNPPSYEVGEQLTVLYPREAPEKAQIKGGGKVLRITFTIVGGIAIFFGVRIFYRNMREDISAPGEPTSREDEGDEIQR